ncbi:MAG: 16S rRNA processing protein RimM [Spirochaetes bacterium RBG_13_51_14]|nr:MAG: 16S rRNA processing protein RimM [Spirochaetes bacterium RBG_13_51_14]
MPADDYVRIAVVTGVHGLAGRLKILVLSDIRERFKVNASVYIKIKDRYKKFTIADYTDYKNKSGLLTLEGIGDRNAAREYKGLDICIEKSEAEKTRSLLDKNSYYYYDIIGCFVYYQGRLFGAVTDILEAGAGEILVISSDTGKQFMIPFVESMVDIGDIRNNKLYIHPVEGLFDI